MVFDGLLSSFYLLLFFVCLFNIYFDFFFLLRYQYCVIIIIIVIIILSSRNKEFKFGTNLLNIPNNIIKVCFKSSLCLLTLFSILTHLWQF